jgi:hypothetical protein
MATRWQHISNTLATRPGPPVHWFVSREHINKRRRSVALYHLFIGLFGLRAHPRAPGFEALLPARDELRQVNALRRVRGQVLEDQDVV